MTDTLSVEDAPESALPRLLVDPPWTRRTRTSAEPIVLKGLKRPKTPTVESWPPGLRDEWLNTPHRMFPDSYQPYPEEPDWKVLAERYRSGEALTAPRGGDRRHGYYWLVMQGPDDLAEELLGDERYYDDWDSSIFDVALQHFAARRGLAAYRLLHFAAKEQIRCAAALVPFLDDATAQLMISALGRVDEAARLWFTWHGAGAASFVIPDALRKPGPKRTKAEQGLTLIARENGSACVVDAARAYGDEAVAAIEALRTDPLDQYPDELPAWDEETIGKLPRLLLRGRDRALPPTAVRHFSTMLLISTPEDPYPGCEQVIELCDPDSLAEFALALSVHDRGSGLWASQGVQYALRRFGDAVAAARLADRMVRWDNNYTWTFKGWTALDVLMAIDMPADDRLRLLDRIVRRGADAKHLRPRAQGLLNTAARKRGLTSEQLADLLVPDLGLDAEGAMTLDYGPRRFVVGFDEQLQPFVTDGDGKPRKTLPKPAAKDDEKLAPLAYQRFADLKKEARLVAADQIERLEKAMVGGRSWAPEEFHSVFAGHPLMRHIVRRLVWSADGAAFRVAEDGTFADVHDNEYVLPQNTRVTLPHPVLLGQDTVAAWASVFGDYEILQPFPQLGRPVHELEDGERDATRLARFEGATAHFGKFMGMTSRGWELGEKETGGFRRQVNLITPDDRHVMVAIEPGIRVLDPEEFAEQTIERVMLMTGRYSGKAHPFGALDPVTASEMLAELTRLTG